MSPTATIDGWTWGVGPIVELPTATNKTLGSTNVRALGPAVVAVRTAHPGVYGLLVNNVFSLGGTSGPAGTHYSFMTINPFINYNFGGGWFVGTSPITTANWDTGGTKWTLPVGARVRPTDQDRYKLPVNLLAGADDNALQPTGSGTWQVRTEVAFIF